MNELLVRDVEVAGERLDVRCRAGRIVEMGAQLRPTPRALVIEGYGGSLIPGLHDHHIHLLAAAAAAESVLVGPPAVRSADDFARALRTADGVLQPDSWLRAVGYHESVAGDLDRHALDRLVGGRPLRVQHRSGAMWVLNTAACAALGVEEGDSTHPMEVGGDGALTGRLFRHDEWLRARMPRRAPPDVGAFALGLATRGVTGITDASPFSKLEDLTLLCSRDLAVRVHVMGGVELAGARFPAPLVQSSVKLILSDHDLPSGVAVAEAIALVHRAGRTIAIHCVTRESLLLALVGWEEAGVVTGDRIEHGSDIPSELIDVLASRGLVVVTQPGFVAERGDDYLREIDAGDHPDLYRCASLLEAGIRVAAGTDAPYGDPDPWRAIAAAAQRRTPSGMVLGPQEVVSTERALGLFLSAPEDPGGPARSVAVGEPADLVVLRAPLLEVLKEPSAAAVARTIVAGVQVAGDDVSVVAKRSMGPATT